MRRVDTCAAVALALSMAILQSACFLSGKPKTVAAAAPPPPQPAVTAQPSQPEPLSVPQTQVQLPPEQPVNQAGIPPATKPEEPTPTPAPTRAPHRTAPTQPKPETPAATPPPAAATPPAEEVAPVQEVLSQEERRHLQESVESRKGDINQLLAQVRTHRLNTQQNRDVKTIHILMEQCDAAGKRGDLREADALAERALVLARDVAGGK